MHLHYQQRLPLLPCQGLRRGRWRLTAPAEVRFQRPTKVAGAVGKVCQLGANVWIQDDSRFLSKMLLHAFFPQINHIGKQYIYRMYIYIYTQNIGLESTSYQIIRNFYMAGFTLTFCWGQVLAMGGQRVSRRLQQLLQPQQWQPQQLIWES